MKVRVIALIAAALLTVVSSSAEARHHHRHHYRHHRHHEVRTTTPPSEWGSSERIVYHPAGCPRSAFCGCGASVRIFGHPVRDLYLASNWFRFPHASPGPGMVAVRNHHVFVIESVNADGSVVAYDANSGHHQTRIHTIPLRGYSVRDPHGGRFAGL